MFRALSVTNPNFKFDQVDVVVDRNSLRKLLAVVTGRLFKTFRMDLALEHSTLIITRRERKSREVINSSQDAGYGHEFERSCTSFAPGLKDSTSHHRVVRYHLGPLDCVVRYEVDAGLDESKTISKPEQANSRIETADEDELEITLRALAINESQGPGKAQRPTDVIKKGRVQNTTTLIELKARKKRPPWKEVLPQLWFGRVPHLALGIHTDGVFHEVIVEDITARYSEWEIRCQSDLRKLVQLLQCLIETLKTSGHKSCVTICNHKVKPLRLEIYKSTNRQPTLPRRIIAQYWKGT